MNFETPANTRRLRALIAMLLLAVANISSGWSAPAPTKPLPATSIYQLPMPLTDQDGHGVKLDDWRGKPLLISMFYGSCQFICPRIVDALKRTEESLGGQGVPVLMVTFDPERDDVAALKAMTEERHLDRAVWTLARTDARNVRKLAAALNIQYRALPSGEFNHTGVLILLDAEGRVAGKTSVIG
ncbi:MAG: SCO family protein [Betaproteobacteria bacterium]